MSLPALLELDHRQYLQDRAYRRVTLIGLRRLVRRGRGKTGVVKVLHEHDSSCCQAESWSQTAQRIWRSLAEDGEPVLSLTVGG